MATIVIPRALQVVANGRVSGRPWVNVWGIRVPTTFLLAQSNADELGWAIRNFYFDNRAYFGGNWTLDSVEVRDLRQDTAPSYDTAATGTTGTATGDHLPPQLAMVLSHKTGLRGRSYRGRTYLAGFTETASSPTGTILSTVKTGVLNALTTARTALAGVTGGPAELAVVSRLLEVATPVSQTVIDDEWDRQDRRKRRV